VRKGKVKGGKDWSKFTHHYIPAPNASQGFHGILLAMMEHYGVGKKVLLLSEPEAVIPVFQKQFPDTTFRVTDYSGRACEDFDFDLNIFTRSCQKYDIVLSQATLEHVCRPSVAIENMAERCEVGGHVVLHTVGPTCPLHCLPIDCVRFFKDFYYNLTKYLPIEVVAYLESGCHHFVVYRKVKGTHGLQDSSPSDEQPRTCRR